MAIIAVSSPARRRGAPRGNQNARKHGFYSQYFPPKDQQDAEESEFHGLDKEINMIRVYMRHIVRTAPPEPTFTEAAEVIRIFCLATARLMRVHLDILDNPVIPADPTLQAVFDDILAGPIFSRCGGAFRSERAIQEPSNLDEQDPEA